MTRDEQIEALKAALVAIEGSIGQAQAALARATTVDDVARLNNRIVTLKARRTQLQFQLLNLEGAGAEPAATRGVATRAAAPRRAFTAKESGRGRALTRELTKASIDRQFVDAALKHAADVSARVDELQDLLAGTGSARPARASKASKHR